MAEVSLQEYTREIDSLIEQNAYDEAISHCKHILQQYPKYIEPYRLIGKAAWNREDFKQAADMFTRILSADPSDFVSRAGLSVVYDKQGSLPDAVWQMERAYELEPANDAIREELRKLYGRRGGIEPDRIPLTRGALARLYMNGELYSEATAELRALLEQEPDRIDLQVLLAEALWRDEQRLEASEIALKILDKMPYCLDANLILGEIWMHSGREEDAQVCLKRAAALDPEGNRAAALFGKASPIPVQPIEFPRLDYVAPTAAPAVEEAPTWLSGIGEPAEAGATPGEIPSWLQGIGLAAPAEATAEEETKEVQMGATTGEPAPDWLSGLAAAAQAPAVGAPAEEPAPEWLTQLRADVAQPTEEMATAPQEAEIPDWLQTLMPPAAGQVVAPIEGEAEPDWLSQLRASAEPEPYVQAAEPEAEAVPDWLTELAAETKVEAEQKAGAEEEPEWLAQLHAGAGAVAGAEATAEPEIGMPTLAPGEIPDWLQELQPQEVQAQAPELPEVGIPVQALSPAEEETPPWLLEGEAIPGPEEAEAFFVEPTAGTEEELAAQAQAEARMAEITGLEPEAQLAAIPEPASAPIPTPAAEETPPWMAEGGAMPTPEEAMAFFAKLAAGKEAELAAQAEAEAEVRMAEITGRKPEAKPAPKAVEAPAAIPEPEPEPATPLPAPVVLAEPPEAEAPTPAPAVEETPPWMAEGGAMPTPEEAMAFFAKLTAGKEAELAAQAQAEAETRMAEITGRKLEVAPEPELEAAAPPVIEVEPVELAAAELPQAEAVEEMLPAFPESIPEWLVEPAAIEAASAETAELPSAEPTPIEEPFAEAMPAARQPITGTAGPDWWYQTLEDEEGPVEEAAPEQLAPAAGAVPLTEEMLISPVAPTFQPAPVTRPPAREAARKPEPVAPPPALAPAPAPARPKHAPKRLVRAKPGAATPPEPVVEVESIMARLHTNPDDPQALLDMARAWVQLDDMGAARGGYAELVRRNIALDDVVSDLERVVEDRRDDVDSMRLLGDAHMKAGHLQQALRLYRQALRKL